MVFNNSAQSRLGVLIGGERKHKEGVMWHKRRVGMNRYI